MTTAADWQARVGDVWAAEWRRTDRSLADLSRRLDAAILAAAPPASASMRASVLDIGCGAGATSAALATARPDLAVTGVDLSPALVALAQARVPSATFRVADAADDGAAGDGVDLLVSRHGVMFFADPVAAFARLFARAAPGATLVFSCFGDPARNAFAGALVADLTGAVPPGSTSPGPFAFADPAHVAAILAAAGWRDAAATAVDFDYVAGEGDDPVGDAVSFLSRIGPLAGIVARDPDRQRPRLTAAVARYLTATRVVFPASAWIWRATKDPS